MTGYLIAAVAALLFAWLSMEAVNVFVPISRRGMQIGGAVVLTLIGVVIVTQVQFYYPVPPREPLPCGDGVDYDTRDGLCYKLVPKQYRRY
jgi:hypothetical protein